MVRLQSCISSKGPWTQTPALSWQADGSKAYQTAPLSHLNIHPIQIFNSPCWKSLQKSHIRALRRIVSIKLPFVGHCSLSYTEHNWNQNLKKENDDAQCASILRKIIRNIVSTLHATNYSDFLEIISPQISTEKKKSDQILNQLCLLFVKATQNLNLIFTSNR